MRRPVNRAETERLLDRLRRRIDRLVLRTTLIAGFPGESEGQFEELLDFVRQQKFQRLGAFAYSAEPGTAAAELDDSLPQATKNARRDKILATQQEFAFAWNENQIGQTMDVLIDCDIPGESNAFLGRSYADAPEIDGAVYVTGENLKPGDIVACEVVATRGYDLIGVQLHS
jgi:ribosomal protein S12 methylthiotransferase